MNFSNKKAMRKAEQTHGHQKRVKAYHLRSRDI